ARTDSRPATTASCDVASITNITVPGFTRSPDFTLTFWMKPSICDCTVDERRRHGSAPSGSTGRSPIGASAEACCDKRENGRGQDGQPEPQRARRIHKPGKVGHEVAT